MGRPGDQVDLAELVGGPWDPPPAGVMVTLRVPWQAKAAVVLAGLWVLSPIDLLPEFLPVIGPLDDVVVVALTLRYAARRVPREVLLEAWPRAMHLTGPDGRRTRFRHWEARTSLTTPAPADHPEVLVAGDPPLGLGNQLGAGHGIRQARSEGQAELLLNPTGPPPCPALCGVIDRRSVRCHGDR